MCKKKEMGEEKVLVGVLALQGSFAEHKKVMAELGSSVREVRGVEDLDSLDGIVLPGGESSAMGIVESGDGSLGLFAKLSQMIASGFPAYGTCAGLILLSNKALCQKQGGQPLIGGLGAVVCRNYFGAQVASFEVPLVTTVGDKDDAAHAVFIRAPAILKLDGEDAEPLATVSAKPCAAAANAVNAFFHDNSTPTTANATTTSLPPPKKRKQIPQQQTDYGNSQNNATNGADKNNAAEPARDVVVAARQNNILVTAFHPELTQDKRWHRLFLDMCRKRKAKQT